jgi:hypothetical protein
MAGRAVGSSAHRDDARHRRPYGANTHMTRRAGIGTPRPMGCEMLDDGRGGIGRWHWAPRPRPGQVPRWPSATAPLPGNSPSKVFIRGTRSGDSSSPQGATGGQAQREPRLQRCLSGRPAPRPRTVGLWHIPTFMPHHKASAGQADGIGLTEVNSMFKSRSNSSVLWRRD